MPFVSGRHGWWAAVGLLVLLLSGPTLAMDLVRLETRTDEAIAKYGVTGKGVIVAILDRGIDWRHPDFRNPDGTTRIKWMLDMSNAGFSPCGAGDPVPIEYSEAQINDALFGGPEIAERDALGHGTVTAGLAAGNGSAFANGKYRGMAPEADLIIVKFTSEGVPAHDDQPAETSFQGCATYALDWLNQKITDLDKPCVAIINSGVQWGPIDGTSAVSREIDAFVGQHRPGRVYIAPSGDEGGFPSHASSAYDFATGGVVHFTKWDAAFASLQLWYSGQAPAELSVRFDDGTLVGPVAPGGYAIGDHGVSIYSYAPPGSEFYPWQSTSGDYAIGMSMEGHEAEGGAIILRAINFGAAGKFDVYYPGGLTGLIFDDHVVAGRLTDYAASHSAIVVGAHVDRDSYTDIDGYTYFAGDEGLAGELWAHSSGGPTRDGRLGIDLTTPGDNTFAAYAQNSYWHFLRYTLIQDGGGWYGGAGATSGSAPIAVGAVALMLQLCPNLTAESVRQILHATARSDGFTGPTPNLDWGYGKLDMLAAMDAVHALCPADFNFDAHVDAADLGLFEACVTGPDLHAISPGCAERDLDHDGDVDQVDFGLFQRCFTGPVAFVVPRCAE